MKNCLFIAVLLGILSLNGCKKEDSNPTQPVVQPTELEGSWIGGDTSKFAWKSIFSGNTMNLRRADSTIWHTGSFEISKISNPQALNFSINQSSDDNYVGKTLFGIYKIEAGVLTLNFAKLGDTVRPANFGLSNVIAYSFTFSPPPAPSTSMPKKGTVNVGLSPTLSWVPSSSADKYTLHVSTKSTFSDSIIFQTNIAAVHQQISGLLNNKRYYWRVSASNALSTSAYSDTGIFVTLAGLPCDGMPTVDFAGKTYHTVQIGNQCWMKENLDVGTRINSSETSKNDTIIQKYCFNDDQSNCDKYGALYTWDEVMNYVATAGAQGICPTGWHIPTIDEYDTLLVFENGDANALKSVGQGLNGGAGTNLSGFSALLAGTRYYGEYYNYLGNTANFWSSTISTMPYHVYMTKYFADIQFFTNDRRAMFSVRCVKN